MTVHGFVVTDSVQCELIARMMREPFTAGQLDCVLIDLGVPRMFHCRYLSLTIIDRLISREHKAGHIRREGRGWRWVR